LYLEVERPHHKMLKSLAAELSIKEGYEISMGSIIRASIKRTLEETGILIP